MSTEKQINANRKNAKKPTGSRTVEGKAAVSKNAVKHGLLTDSLVFGENEADYEAFHNEILTELDPVGAIESTMAERIISLWWRLKRAERMQNEVIEDMIVRKVTNNSSRRCREYDLADHGLRPDDPEYNLDGLALGRIERQDIGQDHAIAQTEALMGKRVNLKKQSQYVGLQPEIWNTNIEILNKLKKQSQFMPGLMGVTPFMKGDYDNISPVGEDENKAEQSQLTGWVEPSQAIPKAFGLSTSLKTGFEVVTQDQFEKHAWLSKVWTEQSRRVECS